MLTKAVLFLVTIALGTLVGFSDLRMEEVQPVALMLLSFGLVLGAAYPEGAWRRALMLGLSVPLAHLVSQYTGRVLPYPVPSFAAGFVALIPAFVGSYIGVGLRRVVAPPREQPRG
ncbi:MAG TPA: hypothetical protein VFJ74_17675 [Gemmatimonadaceae bacterium]|nr:hypothetical protein [Gemmatimonadaceae bacterium]